MKKLFIVALAAFAMASCDRTEVVPTPEMGDAIGFTTSTVNGTRATITTDNLRSFYVQAIHNDTDHFMNFVRVNHVLDTCVTMCIRSPSFQITI